MTPEEAIEIIEKQIITCEAMIEFNENFDPEEDNTKFLKEKETLLMAVKSIKEVQQYREIGTIEEIRKMINQGINNCYMSHKYEHPGYEEGMCAGLRTMNGDGEPVYKCKLCRLNYLFERSEGE